MGYASTGTCVVISRSEGEKGSVLPSHREPPLPIVLLLRSDAPMPMEDPRRLLALFAAVFRTPTASALSKLSRVLFPLAALVVRALSDATSRVIFPTEIAHDDTGPVLHILGVVTDGEFLDEREDVEVFWKEVLIIGIVFERERLVYRWNFAVQEHQLLPNLEARDDVGFLEVFSEMAILRNVSEELEGHENIFVPRHSGDDAGGNGAVGEVVGNRSRVPWQDRNIHCWWSGVHSIQDIECGYWRNSKRCRGLWCSWVDNAAVQYAAVRDVKGLCVGSSCTLRSYAHWCCPCLDYIFAVDNVRHRYVVLDADQWLFSRRSRHGVTRGLRCVIPCPVIRVARHGELVSNRRSSPGPLLAWTAGSWLYCCVWSCGRLWLRRSLNVERRKH